MDDDAQFGVEQFFLGAFRHGGAEAQTVDLVFGATFAETDFQMVVYQDLEGFAIAAAAVALVAIFVEGREDSSQASI